MINWYSTAPFFCGVKIIESRHTFQNMYVTTGSQFMEFLLNRDGLYIMRQSKTRRAENSASVVSDEAISEPFNKSDGLII